ncbi:ubiquinone/menaquinone biosynthesis methyltransferase [Desulfolutivibrio sulfoxidireducens]|uniref:ubiquinone/menaquinone biosynthesis methyltransferase n=1 Tax=Desulfolutivibrio sulfoxidireducens TaxID=2773299 RepID=UPI00159D9AA8|nr:ubiquinone/menaquinone biosynthesis methyltransferase [Desulfolutivibrio sulfoxidireducens]QLA17312.1 ubiquinone/menaquinone biosynthesis methyltransferase [Desulfolutivibrio sulfoxidireducens]
MTLSPAHDVEHGRRVASMFGRIAGFYDFLNHALSLGLDIVWRKRLVAGIEMDREREGCVLDLAAGTLDVALEIARRHPRTRIVAADFTLPMLRRGQAKIKPDDAGRIFPVQADGLALPLPDASMDAATIAFGIRNIRPRQAAYAEMLRVLKPGARFCILEFGTGKRRIWGGAYNFYLTKVLPGFGRLVSGDAAAYRYLADTIRAFPDEDALAGELTRAGFTAVSHTPLASGIVFVHRAVRP